jgi:hypothetical protein
MIIFKYIYCCFVKFWLKNLFFFVFFMHFTCIHSSVLNNRDNSQNLIVVTDKCLQKLEE